MEDRVIDEQMKLKIRSTESRLDDSADGSLKLQDDSKVAENRVDSSGLPPGPEVGIVSESIDEATSVKGVKEKNHSPGQALWTSMFGDDQLDDWTQNRRVTDEAEANRLETIKRIIDDQSLEPWRQDRPDEQHITVGLWPHGSTTASVGENAKAKKNNIETIVGVFAMVWLLVIFWRLLQGTALSIIINFQSLIPLMIIPFFTMMRGATHIRFDENGLDFVSLNAASSKVRKSLVWNQIEKVYLDGKVKPTVLSQSLCFQCKDGAVHSVKLKKIANRLQWEKVLEALDKWCPVTTEGIDRNVFGVAFQDRTSPTYTMLWLEALAAPPRRERLTPITEGTLLCKGRYVLERKLGAGGQGSAFLAQSTTDETKVVLKEYILPIYVDMKARKQALERFEHEAKMLAALDHPSIVKLMDYFVDDHRAYLVLEYIDGDNLQQLVEKSGPMQETAVLSCANALVDILEYLHGQAPPVVHRDFTPDNLIASKDGTIKLIDFMVAQQSDMVQQQSASSTVVGKHAYMAPEQFRGQNRTQSDIYALGCTLFFLSTGKQPEPITQLHPILENENCPLILNEIVSKCTENDYADRYQSAAEIKILLSTVAAAEEV